MNFVCPLAFCLPILFACWGCSGGNSGGLVQVQGNVTLNGQPLADAEVVFRPEGGGRLSSGRTDSNGHYTLSYTATEAGALPGHHRVLISTFVERDQESSDPVKKGGRRESIPSRYNSKTTLEAALEVGKPAVVDFRLTSE
ncbi:carboxypeptidase-like regulatory domain-containing protein [Planctomicrobium sp. SH664]|uniref:carboxypeptidase-like regulatory domain-containing protein n=1 Tax=Planctomicrobium sp. SH664 TaxID=3448125 RepID=UPI003F5B2D39